MRKRYLAVFMSMLIACTQISGSVAVAQAADLIVEDVYVEDVHEHVDIVDELLTADAVPEADVMALEEVELVAEQEELPGEYVSVETEAADDAEVTETEVSEVSDAETSETTEAEVPVEDLNLTEEFIISMEEVDVVPVEVMAEGEGEPQEIVPEYSFGYPDQDPGQRDLIPGHGKWYGTQDTVGQWVVDEDHPEGYDPGPAVITNMYVSGQWTDDSKETPLEAEVLRVEPREEENAYEILAVSPGYAEVTFVHTTEDPTDEDGRVEYPMGFYVYEGMYTVDWHYPDGMECLVREASIEVGSSVDIHYLDERGNACGMPEDDYYLDIVEESADAINTELIEANVLEDGKNISITAQNETGNARIVVDVYANMAGEGEEADYQYVKTKYLYVNIMDGYRVLRFKNAPAELPNLNLGETLDVASWEPVVYELFAGQEETEITEGIEYELYYDADGWVPADPDAEIPALTRTGTWGTHVVLRAYEIYEDEDGNGQRSEFDSEWIWFDSLDYQIDFQYSYGDVYSGMVFTGSPLEITLNTDGLNGLENREDYYVKWFIHGDQEVQGQAEFDGFSIEVNNSSAVVTAMEDRDKDGHRFNIRAEIYCGEEYFTECSTDIELRQTRAEYDLPQSHDMLPHWGSGFGRTSDGRFYDVDHPHGEDFEFEITGMEVTGLWDCDPYDVLDWGTDEEGNYWYNAKNYGAVQISCTYNDRDGNPVEEPYVFEVYVNGDIYSLDGYYPDSNELLLCGDSLEIDTWLQWEYFREEDGHHREEVEDYTLELVGEYDTNIVNAELKDNGNILVTANSDGNYGRVRLDVAAKVDGEEKTRTAFEVEVADAYQVIRLDKLEGDLGNPHLGQSVDFAALEPALYTYINRGEEQVYGDKELNVRWILEYDENIWNASETASEEELPVLTRKEKGWTNINLLALMDRSEDGSGDWQEVRRMTYHFDELNYDVDFEYLYGHRGESFVYSDRAQVLTLNTDNLQGLKGYEIKWYANGHLNGEGAEDAVLMTVDAENPAVASFEVPEGAQGYDVHVEVEVCLGEKVISYTETGFWMNQAREEYHFPGDFAMNPEIGEAIGGWRQGYIEDSYNLDGEEFEFEVTSVRFEGIDGSVASEVLEFQEDEKGFVIPDENGNYPFHTKVPGAVRVICTYKDLAGNNKSAEFNLYVSGEVYYLNADYEDNSELMLRGEEKVIDTWLWGDFYEEERGHYSEEIKEYSIEVSSDYNTEMITVECQANGNIVVTANGEHCGRVDFEVRALIGEDEVARSWFAVEIAEEFNLISLEGDFPDPMLGEVLDIASMNPTVYSYSYVNTEEEKTNGAAIPADRIRWRLEWDDAWRADDPEAELPVLTRIRNWNSEVRLIAEYDHSEDGSGDWGEIASRHYGFGQHDYHVEPELKYGHMEPGVVYIGEDQEQIIKLNTDGLNGLEGYEVEWCVWDNEDEPGDPVEHVTYKATDMRDIHLLEIIGVEGHGDSWIMAGAAILYEGEEIAYFDVGMNVRETRYEYDFPFDMTWLPRWEDAIGGYRNAWIEDADHPYGQDVPYQITSVRVDAENSDEGVFAYEADEDGFIVRDEGGNYCFRAERYGVLKLIYTYAFDENPNQEYENELTFEVAGSSYGFDGTYPNNSDTILPGKTLDITTRVWVDGYDIDSDEHYTEDVADYEIVIDHESYDPAIIHVETEGSIIHVTSAGEFGGTGFMAAAVVNGETVAEQYFSAFVTDYYTEIEPGDTPEALHRLMPGEELSLDAFGDDLKLMSHRTLEDGTQEEIELEAEFFWVIEDLDPNAWYIEENENGIRIVRKQTWGTHVTVGARFTDVNGNVDETHRGFWIDQVDAGIDVTYSYGHRDLEAIYAGEGQEDLVLTLDTQLPILEVDGYRVEWSLNQYDDELGDNTDQVTAVSWEPSADGLSLTLTANEGQVGKWINVYADVYYDSEDGEQVFIGRMETGMHVAEPVYCLAGLETNDLNMVMGGGLIFPGYDEAAGTHPDEIYIQDSSEPEGKVIPVEISNMTYSYHGDESEDPIEAGYLKASMTEDGWFVQFMQPGDYTAVMNVKNSETQEAMEDIVLQIHVHEIMHYVEVNTFGDTPGASAGRMLPDESIQLDMKLMQVTYVEETDERIHEEIAVDSWRFEYDENMVQVSEDGVITAAGLNRGWTWVEVVAEATIDGNKEEIHGGIDVEITGAYYILEPKTLYLEPGVEAQELDVDVKKYSITNKDGVVTDERTAKAVYWDDSQVIVTNTEDGRILAESALAEAEEPVYTAVGIYAVDEDGTEWANTEVEVVICSHELTETVTTAPTCQAAGEKHFACSKCGHEWDEEMAVIKCIEGEGTVKTAPTCAAAGVKAFKCTMCQKELRTEPIVATGQHTFNSSYKVTKEASCTTAGTKTFTCTVCKKATKTEPIAAFGHKENKGAVTKEATCLAAGTKTYSCDTCGSDLRTEDIDKLDGTVTPAASKLTIKLKKSVMASKLVSGLMEEDYIKNVTTSNSKLVTVKKSGSDWKITGKKVTSKKTGTADITVTLASGASTKITFSVQKANVKTTSLKVTNASKKLSMTVGDTLTLETLVKPVTTSDKLTFATSNKKVVAVSKSGTLSAKKAGTATVTVKSGKKSVKIKVTVKAKAPTSFELSKSELTLKVKKSATLKAKFTPTGSEAKVTFKTSNKKVATVSSSGKVTAKKKGTAVITATVKSATGETLTKTCTVTVK